MPARVPAYIRYARALKKHERGWKGRGPRLAAPFPKSERQRQRKLHEPRAPNGVLDQAERSRQRPYRGHPAAHAILAPAGGRHIEAGRVGHVESIHPKPRHYVLADLRRLDQRDVEPLLKWAAEDVAPRRPEPRLERVADSRRGAVRGHAAGPRRDRRI